ncbi:hypothetical protein DZF91_16700, partial [Actinomadura logoneensis]
MALPVAGAGMLSGATSVFFPVLVAAVVTAQALRLRRRLRSLPPLPGVGPGPVPGPKPRPRPAEGTGPVVVPSGADGDDGRSGYAGYEFVTGERVMLSGPVRRAAVGHAREQGLDVLDLVPADLPAERALDLLRTLNPRTYRTDPLAVGRGAGFATAVTSDVLDRAGQTRAALDPGAFGAATARLRKFTTSADLVVVPAACPRA